MHHWRCNLTARESSGKEEILGGGVREGSLLQKEGCCSCDVGGGHGGPSHLDIKASQAQVENRHAGSGNMDGGLAIVAASPELIILVGSTHRQDDAVVHGGGVVGHRVGVHAFVPS